MEIIMIQYCVYFNPSNFPNKYVVRQWAILRGGSFAPYEKPYCVKDTLDEARAEIPEGMYPLMRSPDDDPVIVETWI